MRLTNAKEDWLFSKWPYDPKRFENGIVINRECTFLLNVPLTKPDIEANAAICSKSYELF